LLDVLLIVAPVFVCAVVGYGWVALDRPFNREELTRLIHDIGAPCLVFSQLVSLEVGPELLGRIASGALAIVVATAAVGALLLRVLRLPAHTYLPPIVFGNSGNMGMPLCLFAFGEPGLALGAAYFATVALLHFTAGVWVWSGRVTLGELLHTPLAYAAVAAVAVLWLDIEIPVWLRNTVRLLGGITIPLMLLTLGAALHDLRLASVPRSLLLATLRLGLGFAAGVAFTEWMGLEGVVRGVIIIQASMPIAVFNFLFAERYGRSPESVASAVVLSTLLAFVLLPFLLEWAL
jgi:predicted permease